MPFVEEISKVLAISGDIGIWVIVYVIWKFDRRLLKMEINFENHITGHEPENKQAA